MVNNEPADAFNNRIAKAIFISIPDSMTLTGLSRSTLYRLRRQDLIKYKEISTKNSDDGRKTVRILKSSLLQLDNNKKSK